MSSTVDSPTARLPIGAPAARHLHAFFVAAARPVVAFGIVSSLLMTWALIATVNRGLFGTPAELAFLYAFVYPALAGITAAQVVGESQHCSFTWMLPGVRGKTAFGFFVAGVAVTLIVVGLNAQRAEANPALLLAVGLAAYCLGSLIWDPLSTAVSTVSFAIGLAILVFSAVAEGLATAHPIITAVLVTPATAGFCAWRLFSRRTFRRKPFRPTQRMATSPDDVQRYKHEMRLARKPAGRPWRLGYLGTGSGRWLRAGLYEHWGDIGWSDVLGAQRVWPALLLVIGGDAAIDRAGGGYLERLANVCYYSFFRPPDQPSFGDKPDPHFMVMLVISFIGAAVAFNKPAAVEAGRLYPLSRADRSHLAFLGNLATTALYLLMVGLGSLLLAQSAGWAVGMPLRLDFVPMFLRALLVTVIVMPTVFWIRLRTRSFKDLPAGGRAIVTLAWLIAMWIWVVALCYVLPLILPSPAVELSVLTAMILLSQTIYRHHLKRHFATADLV